MDYNIYLHFLNYDTQKLFRVNPDNSSQYMKSIIRILHAAILLCDEFCIIPTGFYFESALTRKIIMDNRELVESGLIRFVMRESDIYSFLEKKKDGYYRYKNFPNYRSFFNAQVARDLANCAPILNRRNALSRDYCIDKWISQADKMIALAPNEISKRINLSLADDEMSSAGCKIREEIIKYKGAAFLWTNIKQVLKGVFGEEQSLEPLHFLFEKYYYQVYLEEYNATILHELPFESSWTYSSTITADWQFSYRYFEAFLAACGLAGILDYDDIHIMKIRDLESFLSLIELFRTVKPQPAKDGIRSYKMQIQENIKNNSDLSDSVSMLNSINSEVLLLNNSSVYLCGQHLDEKLLCGINEQIFRWAETSPLYKMAVIEPDWDELANALGPNEEKRYKSSYELLKSIWHHHPEFGLMPDYEFLSRKEHEGAYYSQYRDHMTHMLKVYLLGLYLYENQEEIQQYFTEEAFLPIWTITALWHDVGYLIETEDGSCDGKDAKEMFASITNSLSLPLTHLFPSVFKADWEKVKQDQENNHPPILYAFQPLKEILAFFDGYGRIVSLTETDNINPIKKYFYAKAEKTATRSYYDHGIVSSMILLYMWKNLQEYMKKANEYKDLFKKKRSVLKNYLTITTNYDLYVETAAKAIALHNIQKEENLNLSYSNVTLSDFCIPISAEPYAWLLRVCDEMQCWDRQCFISPIDNKKPCVEGKTLSFKDGKMVLSNEGEAKKLHNSLKGIVDPFPSFLT